MSIDDALGGLSRRRMEDLKARLEAALKTCILCGSEHADDYMTYPRSNRGMRASIRLCPACFEKHRLPEGRA